MYKACTKISAAVMLWKQSVNETGLREAAGKLAKLEISASCTTKINAISAQLLARGLLLLHERRKKHSGD